MNEWRILILGTILGSALTHLFYQVLGSPF